MNLPHPYRYPRAFAGQLARLERLQPGITYEEVEANPTRAFLASEQNGVTDIELASRNGRLRHLECLIADWVADGEMIYRVEVDAEAAADLDQTTVFPDMPPAVTYIEFEPTSALSLSTVPGSRVEGVYMREIVTQGRFGIELTVVCQERGWSTMDTCLYADAMEIGARIGLGVIPLAEEISIATITQSFQGDPLLSGDDALSRAIFAAGTFATSGLWQRQRATTRPGYPSC